MRLEGCGFPVCLRLSSQVLTSCAAGHPAQVTHPQHALWRRQDARRLGGAPLPDRGQRGHVCLLPHNRRAVPAWCVCRAGGPQQLQYRPLVVDRTLQQRAPGGWREGGACTGCGPRVKTKWGGPACGAMQAKAHNASGMPSSAVHAARWHTDKPHLPSCQLPACCWVLLAQILVVLPDFSSLSWVIALGAGTTVGFSVLATVGAGMAGAPGWVAAPQPYWCLLRCGCAGRAVPPCWRKSWAASC